MSVSNSPKVGSNWGPMIVSWPAGPVDRAERPESSVRVEDVGDVCRATTGVDRHAAEAGEKAERADQGRGTGAGIDAVETLAVAVGDNHAAAAAADERAPSTAVRSSWPMNLLA